MRYVKLAAALAVASLTAVVMAASASAAPAPGYEEFAGCPDKTVDPAITGCFVSTVTGGHLKLGTKDTQIVDPITLIGASKPGGLVVGSFDGGRQPVPGGLVGLTGLDWLIYLFPNEILGVYAEAELAGTPGVPLANPFTLPLKIQLNNVLLADTCYIGSNANPVTLNLITGTTNPPPPNQPITGSPGTLSTDPALPGVLRATNRVLVDNSFAVPAAQGCDLTGLGAVDALVNLQAGLPSAAGNNTAVQNANAALGTITRVYPPAGIDQ